MRRRAAGSAAGAPAPVAATRQAWPAPTSPGAPAPATERPASPGLPATFCAVQVVPPLVVASSAPPSPAIQPLLASRKRTARSRPVLPLVAAVRAAPPSLLRSTVPP